MRRFIAAATIAVFWSLSAGTSATMAADIRVLSSNGMREAMIELAPHFEHGTGHKLSIRYDTAAFLQRDIERGESFDVAVMTTSQFDAVAKTGKFDLATRTRIALSGVGIATRQGAPKPDISSVDAFKHAMLAAKSIAFATVGTSGVHFMAVCERLGIAAEVKAKGKTLPGGSLGEFVAKGEAELAIQQISELLPVEGIELVGPLPAELQLITPYTAAVGANSKEAATGTAFIRFLTTPAAHAVFKAKGLDPG
jgi:molybdate transport system substrate-binding protein